MLSVGEEDPPDWAENLADIYEMFKCEIICTFSAQSCVCLR